MVSISERVKKAIALASQLLVEADRERTFRERRELQWIAGLLKAPDQKARFVKILDSAFRTENNERLRDQLTFLLEGTKYAFLRFWLKCIPSLTIACIKKFLRLQMRQVIAPGESHAHKRWLKTTKKSGVYINLNRLGEAILGDKEATKRLNQCLEDLSNPLIDVISIKISSIASQLHILAWDHTLEQLKGRLRTLFRKAMKEKKSITLDMEEYKDLYLTKELFCQVLEEQEFHNFTAGIALQSYIPDSYLILQELITFAKQRAQPIKIRLVKGANLGMERVEASLKEWPQAPYQSKGETDANFMRMLHLAIQHCPSVELGIGSHNLFDLAYAMLLAVEMNVSSSVTLEMLSGMAPHIQRTVAKHWKKLLLYCPAVEKKEMHTAMAYLARRLDENTASENFLAHLFDLTAKSAVFKELEEAFALSCLTQDSVSSQPRRESVRKESINEPDTDWMFLHNRELASTIYATWKTAYHEIPLVIDGKTISSQKKAFGIDPSKPQKKIHEYSLADDVEIEKALNAASTSARAWAKMPLTSRIMLLKGVAESMRKDRLNLIGAMCQEAGKIIPEADSEVSEAIDFLSYYTKEAASSQTPEIFSQGKVALVLTPWNFPCSIPCSAITSALTCGYSVIFKPAPEAVLSGWLLVNHFWKAGVPKEVLQFVTCVDDPTGWKLVCDQRVEIAILTGATATAKAFLERRPALRLFAETGGKNSMIVTALADRDLAIKDIISSAFGYAGQKCSALSLLILEEEVYNSKSFRDQLYDAASTMIHGSTWNFETILNPLIRPATPHLLRALTTLEPGEEWLLKPVQHPENSHAWSPGIKFGVQPNSFTHKTELFGPLLAVMCAKDLDDACRLANGTPYGLTAGLHSLDSREQEKWLRQILAGNCYINRGITGAIVGRQPFGGCKASNFGIGMKVGGPHYLYQLGAQSNKVYSYSSAYKEHFQKEEIMRRLVGQDNFIRYVPKAPVFVLIQENDDPKDIEALRKASEITGCHAHFESNLDRLAAEILKREAVYLRALKQPPVAFLQKISSHIASLDIAKPSPDGRQELLHWLREIAISSDYHRYGSLMDRQDEYREPTL